jgi:heme exporter protein D
VLMVLRGIARIVFPMSGSTQKRKKLLIDVSRKDARRIRFESKNKFKKHKREVKYETIK